MLSADFADSRRLKVFRLAHATICAICEICGQTRKFVPTDDLEEIAVDKAQLKFLVVDDSSTMRRIVRLCLMKYGIAATNVVEAADGLEALAQLGKSKFDCILADWNMPNCDGMELLQRTRALPGYEHTPFILITSEAGRDDIILAIKAGVSDYIVKPILYESISKKLDSALG